MADLYSPFPFPFWVYAYLEEGDAGMVLLQSGQEEWGVAILKWG